MNSLILVTGAGGQVGVELIRRGPQRGHQIIGLARADLDISDGEAVSRCLADRRPGVVINAAAYTAVDKAESDEAAAQAGNEAGPANLARACAEIDVPLIHISTDYVFDGTKQGAYAETDPVHPLGVYGVTKEAGEQKVRETWAHHVILRTSWVYAAHGGNFVRTMLRLGAERDELGVVADQAGTPTSAGDIAEAALSIAEQVAAGRDDAWGTYHFTAKGSTTWHGFAEEIFRRAEPVLGKRPKVNAITTADFPTPARRPANSVLDCSRIDAVLAPPRRSWQEGLADVLSELLADGAQQ